VYFKDHPVRQVYKGYLELLVHKVQKEKKEIKEKQECVLLIPCVVWVPRVHRDQRVQRVNKELLVSRVNKEIRDHKDLKGWLETRDPPDQVDLMVPWDLKESPVFVIVIILLMNLMG
jgi:hypothetical protein